MRSTERNTIQSIFIACLLALLFLSGRPVADSSLEPLTLQYDVVKNNKVVGKLMAWRTVKNDIVGYKMESDVKVDILFTISVYSMVEGFFNKGQLTEGKILRKVNGKEKANTHIVWSQNKYFIKDPGKTLEFKPKIFYTTACFMHIEPSQIKQVFSENYKKFLPIKKINATSYELQLPDGNRNVYTYSNGVCIQAKVPTALATIYFKLRK